MKTLYPFQQVAVEVGMLRPLLLADECGLGKTITAIEIAKRRMNELEGPTLIIAPLRTREQWRQELAGQDPDRKCYILDTSHLEVRSNAYHITHYEAIRTLANLFDPIIWTTIIVDEAHRIKNRKALCTKAIKQLSARRRIALTGTPLEKTPADLWSLLNWLYPGYFNSYWRFHDRYVQTEPIFRGGAMYRKDVGGKNLDELMNEIKYFMLQRTKKEVAPQLPEKIETVVPLRMSNEQLELYDTIATSSDIEVAIGQSVSPLIITNVMSQIIKLQQVASWPGRLLDVPVPSCKLDWLDDFLDDNPEEPVVVFTVFRETAIGLAERYQDATLLIGGSDWQNAEDFLQKRKRILIGTIATMSEGLNLQRARTAVFFDLHWSSIKMRQAIDRVHRIDIKEPKQIIYLIASPVDDLVFKAFTTKMELVDLVRKFLEMHQ